MKKGTAKFISSVVTAILLVNSVSYCQVTYVPAAESQIQEETNELQWSFNECYITDENNKRIKAYEAYPDYDETMENVTEITVPAEYQGKPVVSVDGYFFGLMRSLKKIATAENSKYLKSVDGVLYSSNMTELLSVPADYDKSVTVFRVPESVTTIHSYAFSNNRNIEEIILSDGITTVPEYAFTECSSLKKVFLSDSVKKICENAFSYCGALHEVNIPSAAVIDTGFFFDSPSDAFNGCDELIKFNVSPDNPYYTEKDGILFSRDMKELLIYPPGKKETEFELPDTVEKVADAAVKCGLYLKNFIIPDGNVKFRYPLAIVYTDDFTISSVSGTEAEEYAKKKGIKFTDIEAGVTRPYYLRYEIRDEKVYITSCRDRVFNLYMPLTIEGFPVAEIDYNFLNKESLELVIPGASDDGFGNRYELHKVIFEDGTETVDAGWFARAVDFPEIYIPESVKEIKTTGMDRSHARFNASVFRVDEKNSVYCDIDGSLFSRDKTKLFYYSGKSETTEYSVPDGVTEIAEEAFQYGWLSKISIPDSVSRIDNKAFYNCDALKYIKLSDKTEFIGEKALGYIVTEEKSEEKDSSFVIEAPSGSAAEKYAEENSILFLASSSETKGDLNGDGVLSAADVLLYKKLLTGKVPVSSDVKNIADINGDKKMNVFDLTRLINRIFSSLSKPEPIPDQEPGPVPDPYYPEYIKSFDELPSMDGSTSAIPLEAGIKARLSGQRYYSGLQNVSHNKTHVAFQNLLSGETDLIFSVPISEDQQKAADEAGVHLNMIPVAKEAFVFIVNKDNPVSTLTQQQIRDIYSGKITNWSEVGGNDEKIIPYQRNKDSGSQNYMDEFMDGYDLMDAPSSMKSGEMGDLMERIATYSNASGAIGYSVYSYAAQMYENSDSVKLIAVDGTAPTKDTLAEGTYPLMSNTYIIHLDNPNEKTERFINWITSDAGQECVMNCGYLPVADIEFPDRLRLYNAVGTGKKMPDNYVPSRKISVLRGTIKKDSENVLGFIKDITLRSMILNDISNAEAELDHENEGVRVDEIDVYGENGYLSFTIGEPKNRKCLTYDLTEHKRITRYSDLFFKDSNFVPLLNKSIAYMMSEEYWSDLQPDVDFLGVTGTVEDFTLNSIKLSDGNPYYINGKYRHTPVYIFSDLDWYGVSFNFLPSVMVTGIYRDFSDIIGVLPGNIKISQEYRREWYCHSEKYYDNIYKDVIIDSLYHTREETEKRNAVYDVIYEYMNEHNQCDENRRMEHLFYKLYGPLEIPDPYEQTKKIDSYYILNILTGLIVNKNLISSIYGSWHDHHIAGYDMETGEPLTFEDIFGPEFSDIDESYSSYSYNISAEPCNDDKVVFEYSNSDEITKVEIPVVREHLNMKYFISVDDI